MLAWTVQPAPQLPDSRDLHPDLLDSVVPVTEPVPLRHLRLRPVRHVGGPGADLDCARLVHPSAKLPPLPTGPLPFSDQARLVPWPAVDAFDDRRHPVRPLVRRCSFGCNALTNWDSVQPFGARHRGCRGRPASVRADADVEGHNAQSLAGERVRFAGNGDAGAAPCGGPGQSVDSIPDTRWKAKPRGHLFVQHDHATPAAGRARRKGHAHRGGGRRVRSVGKHPAQSGSVRPDQRAAKRGVRATS